MPSGEPQAPHWTGLAPRAIDPSNSSAISQQCLPTPDPPFPGPTWQEPKIHNAPRCLNVGGWHDIAGAFTYAGVHHVFQGCPADGGWHHAASADLVHWEDKGIHPYQMNETYAGMESLSSPCSGFVTEDDDGNICAGFRQCSSTRGVAGGAAWDVPLELRCADGSYNLTTFGPPDYLFNVSYYRPLP